MALHVVRHIIRQARKDAGLERPVIGTAETREVRDNEVKAGTEWHDAVAITASVIALGGVALCAEHFFSLDGDVTYDVLACCAAHPVSRVFKAVLLAIA